MHFVLSQRYRHAQHPSFTLRAATVRANADCYQYSSVSHLAVLSHLLVTSVQYQVAALSQLPVAPSFQHSIQLGRSSADGS